MRALGNKLVSGLACLAAILTPLSGVPHIVCRCPDGHLKPFCLSITTKKSAGCCCGGACCSSGKVGKVCCCACRTRGTGSSRHGARATCCDLHEPRPGEGVPTSGPRLTERPCCQKTLVAAESLAVARAKATAGDDLGPSADVPAQPAFVRAPEAGSLSRIPRLAHSPGPPADLITLLSRLVI
jgi:hypothetical protein